MIVALELMGILPRTFPSNLDVDAINIDQIKDKKLKVRSY